MSKKTTSKTKSVSKVKSIKAKAPSRSSVNLTTHQIAHLVAGAVQNMIDLSSAVDNGALRFIITVDNMDSKNPVTAEEKNEEEIQEMIGSHMMWPLFDFVQNMSPVQNDTGGFDLVFHTIPLTIDNIPDFILALQEMDEMWEEIDQDIADSEEAESKTKGKNVVTGNSTIN